MYQYVYVSSAITPFSDQQLVDLLEVSRRKNSACAVTGLLLYLHGNFIQLLEGTRIDVESIRACIETDTRHRGMTTLLEGDCAQRQFPDWSMGFEKLGGPEAEKMPGYSDFLRHGADLTERSAGALRLLEFFREINT